jgi:hypothetical protein
MHFKDSWTETPTLLMEGLEYYQQWERVTSGTPTDLPGFFREIQWTPSGLIRIGAAIPSPASGGALALGLLLAARRRR